MKYKYTYTIKCEGYDEPTPINVKVVANSWKEAIYKAMELIKRDKYESTYTIYTLIEIFEEEIVEMKPGAGKIWDYTTTDIPVDRPQYHQYYAGTDPEMLKGGASSF